MCPGFVGHRDSPKWPSRGQHPPHWQAPHRPMPARHQQCSDPPGAAAEPAQPNDPPKAEDGGRDGRARCSLCWPRAQGSRCSQWSPGARPGLRGWPALPPRPAGLRVQQGTEACLVADPTSDSRDNTVDGVDSGVVDLQSRGFRKAASLESVSGQPSTTEHSERRATGMARSWSGFVAGRIENMPAVLSLGAGSVSVGGARGRFTLTATPSTLACRPSPACAGMTPSV